jgi:hypothetical protein
MNRKTRGNLFFMAALFLGGCTTMRPTAPPVPGAAEYREAQAGILQQQAELAITGTKIGEDSRDIVEGITAIESTLAVPDYDREKLVNQVRELRVIAEKHQADTETLNRQLAGEREATRRQGELFDKREEAWQTALSDRDREINVLQINNLKVIGQRNMTFVISVTLVLAWVLYIVHKLCHKL